MRPTLITELKPEEYEGYNPDHDGIWITFRNGKLDEVFQNLEDAQSHCKKMIKTWSLIDIKFRKVNII